MSLITFANLVMASSEKEKCKARVEAHFINSSVQKLKGK